MNRNQAWVPRHRSSKSSSVLASWTAKWCAAVVIAVTTAIALPAQTFTTLYSFPYNIYTESVSGLIQATDGNLYGTTSRSGANNYGTVFKITTGGTLTTLHSFDGSDGMWPEAGLLQTTDGDFYGTTQHGGAFRCYMFISCGVIFKVTPSRSLTVLHTFDISDGRSPLGGLVQATDGNLYGTTSSGGANGGGTVFKITPDGTLTTLHNFDGSDGDFTEAGLLQATDGNFYGTTQTGGANQRGTVFRVTPNGTLTTLHSFCSQSGCADGVSSNAALVQATDGKLYGVTQGGGVNNVGTVFKIALSGTLTTLHSFDSADGAYPTAALVQATDGNLYGTTEHGGVNGVGTVFKITPSGTLTTLHSFDSTDGAYPSAALVQDTDGSFYGTTQTGGANNDGTVFSLSVGLGPFVETLPTSGKVGAAVEILGTNLTGATSVKFNGTTAAFTVVSSSLITTNVPAGATSGKVEVTTPHGSANLKLMELNLSGAPLSWHPSSASPLV